MAATRVQLLCFTVLFVSWRCIDGADLSRRAHGGPEWIMHCWDNADGHLMDPFCPQHTDCGPPPDVMHGNHELEYTTSANSTIKYTCQPDYHMTGEATVMCIKQADYTAGWTKPPTCKLSCGPAPFVEMAEHQVPFHLLTGSEVNYRCAEGYDFKDGVGTIVCQEDGKWSQKPVCLPLSCRPPVIAHGSSNAEVETAVGSSITVRCDKGYQMLGSPTVVCVESNGWGPLPECVWGEPTCGNPEVSPYSEIEILVPQPPTTTPETPATTITVEPPECIETPDDPYCQGTPAPATTTIADCIETPDDPYCRGTTTPEVTLVPEVTVEPDVECIETPEDPYCQGITTPEPTPEVPLEQTTIEPEPEVTITDCIETPEDPYCQGDASTTVTMPASTTIDIIIEDEVPEETMITGYPLETITVYRCTPGYVMIGQNTSYCMMIDDVATWSRPPFCVADCGPPPTVENGTAYYTSTTEGSTAAYECDAGYRVLGSARITCLATGQWSQEPVCRSECGAPPAIHDGVLYFMSTTIGATAAYSCDEGFVLTGPEVSTCQDDHTWSEAPTCELDLECGEPPVVRNSYSERLNETEAIMYRYTCYDRYYIEGSDTVTCQRIGNVMTWTEPPVCYCQHKPVDIIFIIDGSGSVGEGGFNQTLYFVSDLISRYPADTTRFAMSVFSTDVTLVFHLGDFVDDRDAMMERLFNATYPAGATSTYDALRYAREEMFTEDNGMRPEVDQAAIVVTDGQSDNFNETANQASLLRDNDVTIYSVGVGKYAAVDELKAVASDERYVFTVDDYDTIDTVAGPLADITCHDEDVIE